MMKNMVKKAHPLYLSICILSLAACNSPASKTSTSTAMTDSTTTAALPTAAGFEKTIDGKQTHFYTLKNTSGAEATLTNYGAHLISLQVPDKTGKLTNVVIGFPDIEGYKKSHSS